jgi:RNA polymerase-binding transcription factor DksA
MERQRSAVLAALRRLENGVYGRCVDCGQPVSEGRLDARPDAARCVICQGKYDKTQHEVLSRGSARDSPVTGPPTNAGPRVKARVPRREN